MARRSLEVDCYAVVAVTFAVATLFTVLRFWARHITKVKLWWDDWFAAAAFVSLTCPAMVVTSQHLALTLAFALLAHWLGIQCRCSSM